MDELLSCHRESSQTQDSIRHMVTLHDSVTGSSGEMKLTCRDRAQIRCLDDKEGTQELLGDTGVFTSDCSGAQADASIRLSNSPRGALQIAVCYCVH